MGLIWQGRLASHPRVALEECVIWHWLNDPDFIFFLIVLNFDLGSLTFSFSQFSASKLSSVSVENCAVMCMNTVLLYKRLGLIFYRDVRTVTTPTYACAWCCAIIGTLRYNSISLFSSWKAVIHCELLFDLHQILHLYTTDSNMCHSLPLENISTANGTNRWPGWFCPQSPLRLQQCMGLNGAATWKKESIWCETHHEDLHVIRSPRSKNGKRCEIENARFAHIYWYTIFRNDDVLWETEHSITLHIYLKTVAMQLWTYEFRSKKC